MSFANTLRRGGLAVAFCLLSTAANAAWINELHYDNLSSDVGEFVEIAGLASENPDDFSIVRYNGKDGLPYTGFLADPDPVALFREATYWIKLFRFKRNGLQNGRDTSSSVEGDGIALLDGSTVAQFISYEGVFTALGGPAAGLSSVDIGVEEASDAPVGTSIGLRGSVFGADGLVWTHFELATPGAVNAGQSFAASREGAVPDSGATLALLGLALGGLLAWRRCQG